MYPNHQKKLCFLALPRTGSQAVAKYLTDSYGFSAEHGHHEGPGAFSPSWTYFTVVRNHFDAFASWYFTFQGQAQRKKDLITVDWLRTLIDKRLKRNYFSEPGVMWWYAHEPVKVVRYENLRNELATLLNLYGIQIGPRIPVHNRGQWRKGMHYRKVFTPDARALVEYRFGAEMERLGYSY